jgi:hypothetical protein
MNLEQKKPHTTFFGTADSDQPKAELTPPDLKLKTKVPKNKKKQKLNNDLDRRTEGQGGCGCGF